MPLRPLGPIAAGLLALTLAVAACGGDDGGGSSPTPSSAASPTSSPAATQSPGGDEKTPPAEETPGPVETTDAASVPSATPGAGGRPAVAPQDQNAFLARFSGLTIDLDDCTYNPATLLASCGAHGDFSVDPPLTGEDVSCQIGLADGEPVYVRCSSQVPLTSIYYEILE